MFGNVASSECNTGDGPLNLLSSSNEEQWLVILRGFVTISSILLIVAFAFTSIILGPVRELSLTSIRESRSTALPTDISNVPVDSPKVVFQVGSAFFLTIVLSIFRRMT